MIEELNLKEKLVWRRALVLLRSLLKQSCIDDIDGGNHIGLFEKMIVNQKDPELGLIVLECIGL